MKAKDFLKMIDEFDIDECNGVDTLSDDYVIEAQKYSFVLDEMVAILTGYGNSLARLRRAYALGYMKGKGIYTYEEIEALPDFEINLTPIIKN